MRKSIVYSLNWKKAIGPSKCVKGGGSNIGGIKIVAVKENGSKKPAATVKPLREMILKGKTKQAYNDVDYEVEDEDVGDDVGVGNRCNNSDGEGDSVTSSCFMENMMMEYVKMKSRKRKGVGVV
ncbi:uncharacterized protein LOC110724018 [Chenopodium quinoa]|uniref:uncharacterized protein LOC110724018 n=1 Tax=Chenopodium quinoa TaxID=63459 RepID=UPI000B7821DD|nr:uncharacterized protein LOC110724018 [Chenopodium quinoa]XP_021759115.1 uncharacterized protein LOC110724018 [Chenopodium quinoa]